MSLAVSPSALPDPWALLAATPIAMAVLDGRGCPSWWNAEFERCFERLKDGLDDGPETPGEWRLAAVHPDLTRLLAAGGGSVEELDLSASIFAVTVSFVDRRPFVALRDRTDGFQRRAFEEVSGTQMRQAAERMGDVTRSLTDGFPRIEANAGDTAEAAQGVQRSADRLRDRLEAVVSRALSISEVTDAAVGASRDARRVADGDATRTRKALEAAEHESLNMAERAQVISDIAQQTRILALNISIGAARVGSVGQEFSVIAQQVRELAGLTEQTARRIEESTSILREALPDALTSLGALSAHIAGHQGLVEELQGSIESQRAEVLQVQSQVAAEDGKSSMAAELKRMGSASETTLRIIGDNAPRLEQLARAHRDVERAVARNDGEPKLTPSDVYRMARVIHHLLDAWTARPSDRTPRRFAGKTPEDVLARLDACGRRLGAVMGLDIDLAPPRSRVTPTQVFVRARRLVHAMQGQFQRAHRALPDAAVREPPHCDKTPSDVYAQVDLLHERLEARG